MCAKGRAFVRLPARWLWPVLVAAVMLATSCAKSPPDVSPPRAEASPTVELGDVPAVNWDNPINGEPVDSVSEAASIVLFEIHMPEGLGKPLAIYVSGPETPRESALVEFVFDDPTYGRIVTFQRLPEVAPKDYDATNEQLVQANAGPSSMEIDVIRDDENALVVTSPDGTAAGVYWLEGGVEFWVGGPSLTKTGVIAIAEKL